MEMTNGETNSSYTNVVCVLKRLPKEQAGLIVRGTVVKGIIGFLGYELGTMMFSQAPKIGRYELLLQQVREATEKHEGTLRALDKCEEELVQMEEKFNKLLMKKYDSRASKN